MSRQVVMSKERYTYLCVFVYMYAKSRFDERDTTRYGTYLEILRQKMTDMIERVESKMS